MISDTSCARAVPDDRIAMHWNAKALFPYLAAACGLGALAWAASFGRLPPADFAFANGTEIKSVDPHIVTGVPEHRIIDGIFEGLCQVHPETLKPIPGLAERWELSEDKRTYTFYLRPQALWSDGSPITAEDFVWSWRRFLHPETGAEYGYQGWYIRGAEDYTSGRVRVGMPVEIELDDRPDPSQLFPRGTVLYGTLVATEPSLNTPGDSSAGQTTAAPPENHKKTIIYVVDIDGELCRFAKEKAINARKCLQILPDFRTVGVEALDEHTLQVTLKNPTPYLLDLVAMYCLYPVHRGCIERFGYPQWTKPENIVSNGPYLLKFRRIRDRIRMVKNPRYWDADNVQLKVIDALAVNSDITMFNMYMDGQVDWATSVPSTIIPQIKDRADYLARPCLATYFYRLNVNRPALRDARVRQALNLAMDKQEIVDRVTRAGQIPATSIVPDGLEGYQPGRCGEYNPDEAQRLLADAGFPGGKGFPVIEILYNTLEGHQRIAEVVQRQWRRTLGIEVRLVNQEWAVFLDSTKKLEHWVARAGWNGDYPDPNTFLDMFVTDGANNQTGWGNREYDRLIEAAAAEADAARRLQILHDAEQILMDEMPIIPIYYYVRINMVRPYVKGFFANVLDEHPLTALRIDPEERRQALARRRR